MLFRSLALAVLSLPLWAQTTSPSRTGSFAQIAVGYFDVAGQRGTWTTSMVFMNVGSAAANVQVRLFTSAGQALTLPVTGVGTVSERQLLVPPNGSARIDFDADSVPLGVGWAEVTAGTSIRGQGIYRTRVPGKPSSEAAVPLLVREPSACLLPLPTSVETFPNALILPFDNTQGYVSSIAFANATAAAATLEVEFLDEAGIQIHSLQQSMPARSHTAFETTSYPAVRGKKGVVRVKQNPSSFTAIAFLFSPDGPFTTLLPVVR